MEGCQAGISRVESIDGKPTFLQPQLVQRQETLVMGIEIRTASAQEMQPALADPQLWSRFLAEQLPPHRADSSQAQTVYGVYTDYASDAEGEYSLILATEVSNIDNPPEHQVGIAIPAGCYLVFEGSGDPAKAAVQIWRQVWSYFRTGSPYQRAFTTDFELYEPQQTRIYIAVKSA